MRDLPSQVTLRQCVRTERKSGIGYRGPVKQSVTVRAKIPYTRNTTFGALALLNTSRNTSSVSFTFLSPPPPFMTEEQLRWSIYNEILFRENDLLSRVIKRLIKSWKREIILWKTIGYYLVKSRYYHEYPGEGFQRTDYCISLELHSNTRTPDPGVMKITALEEEIFLIITRDINNCYLCLCYNYVPSA